MVHSTTTAQDIRSFTVYFLTRDISEKNNDRILGRMRDMHFWITRFSYTLVGGVAQ